MAPVVRTNVVPDRDSSWVTLLGSSDRRGGTSAVRKQPPAELIWKVALPESIRSSPVLKDGVVYVTCRDGRLYALDARTGKQRWTFLLDAPSHSTPALAGPLIVFGSDAGTIYA